MKSLSSSRKDANLTAEVHRHHKLKDFFKRARVRGDDVGSSTETGHLVSASLDGLCSACRRIDWESALDLQSTSSVRKVVKVDLLDPSMCPFCNFLRRSLGPFPRQAQRDLLAVRVEPSLTPILNAVDAFVLGLVPQWDFGFRSIFALRSDLIFELTGENAHTLKPILPLVDFGDIRPWLDLCLD